MSPTTYVLPDNSNDLREFETLLDELEDYLVEDKLYRTVLTTFGRGKKTLKLSLGDLLTRLQILYYSRGHMTDDERVLLDNAQVQFTNTAQELQSRFNQRAEREINAHLDALSWFLADCGTDIQRCRDEYPSEMRNRQRIEELVKHLGEDISDDTKRRLAEFDAKLRNLTDPESFIWDEFLGQIYHEEPYWYLYALPKM